MLLFLLISHCRFHYLFICSRCRRQTHLVFCSPHLIWLVCRTPVVPSLVLAWPRMAVTQAERERGGGGWALFCLRLLFLVVCGRHAVVLCGWTRCSRRKKAPRNYFGVFCLALCLCGSFRSRRMAWPPLPPSFLSPRAGAMGGPFWTFVTYVGFSLCIIACMYIHMHLYFVLSVVRHLLASGLSEGRCGQPQNRRRKKHPPS